MSDFGVSWKPLWCPKGAQVNQNAMVIICWVSLLYEACFGYCRKQVLVCVCVLIRRVAGVRFRMRESCAVVCTKRLKLRS